MPSITSRTETSGDQQPNIPRYVIKSEDGKEITVKTIYFPLEDFSDYVDQS